MRKFQKGTITPALIIITGSFIVVIYGLLLVLGMQLDFSNREVAGERALNIAESGINYYRWHLAHAPEDFQDGTGVPGPYVHDFLDPQGAKVGSYSLDIIPPEGGSSLVTIRSTGWSDSHPNVQRTIEAQYGIPSLAQYSFLMNASGWYGTNITVNGEIHSNNGIRMDGTNTSLVKSAKETYTCGSETGCSPPQSKPGVWGSGGDSGLWQFPVPAVDFDSVSFDFGQMRTNAQSNGLYLPHGGYRGYHLVFNGTSVDVYRVTNTRYYNGYDGDEGCHRLYQRIRTENLIGTYNVSDVPIIFAENILWIEGTLDGRTTVVAARFPLESYETDIWINGNILYQSYDNSDALGILAQHDIYYIRNLPNEFQIDAALMAQTGKIIRHGYFWWCGGTSNAVKDKLTINGSVISYNKSYWNYGSSPTSGFRTREINYDADFLFAPPPYFPTSGEYEFISWKEL